MKLDKFDISILEALQQDARLSLQDLGKIVGLTASPCWTRVSSSSTAAVTAAMQDLSMAGGRFEIALHAAEPSVRAQQPARVSIKGTPMIKVVYRVPSAPNPVIGMDAPSTSKRPCRSSVLATPLSLNRASNSSAFAAK